MKEKHENDTPKRKKRTERQERKAEKLWIRLLNDLLSLILACATVLPLLYVSCKKIAFSFQINDDAVMMQILNGSYTGTPDGHAVFMKYPLSWIISQLYKINPSWKIGSLHFSNVNWYVGAIVVLYGFSLIMVLFRLMTHFRCNRFLICAIYAFAFLKVWLPYFSEITFSVAAAFFGCAALAYLALESRDEAWHPWNLVILGILMTASYCMRPSCFYMAAPFILIEFIVKYNIMFFKSWKPWFSAAIILLMCVGVWFVNKQAYSSTEWKEFLTYNHDRAYLQDYVGFPDYEENKDFYDSIDMDEEDVKAMAHYSYCLDDDFSKDCVIKTYEYVKQQEKSLSWKEKILSSWKKAKDYCLEKKQASYALRFLSLYLWLMLIPLIPVTLILRCRAGLADHILHTLQAVIFAGIMALEWIYLAIKGRFPTRVEVSIRVMMLTVALVLLCHFLQTYREVWTCRVHGFLQILIIVALCPFIFHYSVVSFENVQSKQQHNLNHEAEKGEVLAYCGQHPENYYILNVKDFTKTSLPDDDYHQMNWIMSASWSAYSPLYEKKLEDIGTDSLGSSFLTRDNVYIITKGKKDIADLMAKDDDEVSYTAADEFCSSSNNIYEIYKVTGVN